MSSKSAKKTLLGVVVCAAWILGVGANAALAGEITGNGKSLKNPDGSLNGSSICAFSGQNDTYSGDPDVADADGFFRTQSWGQYSKAFRNFLTSIGVNPGNSCKPNGE